MERRLQLLINAYAHRTDEALTLGKARRAAVTDIARTLRNIRSDYDSLEHQLALRRQPVAACAQLGLPVVADRRHRPSGFLRRPGDEHRSGLGHHREPHALHEHDVLSGQAGPAGRRRAAVAVRAVTQARRVLSRLHG